MRKVLFILSFFFVSSLAFAIPSLGPKRDVKIQTTKSFAGTPVTEFGCEDCYKHYKNNLSSPNQKPVEAQVSEFLGTNERKRSNTRSIRDN
jgi:hypothetical protein